MKNIIFPLTASLVLMMSSQSAYADCNHLSHDSVQKGLKVWSKSFGSEVRQERDVIEPNSPHQTSVTGNIYGAEKELVDGVKVGLLGIQSRTKSLYLQRLTGGFNTVDTDAGWLYVKCNPHSYLDLLADVKLVHSRAVDNFVLIGDEDRRGHEEQENAGNMGGEGEEGDENENQDENQNQNNPLNFDGHKNFTAKGKGLGMTIKGHFPITNSVELEPVFSANYFAFKIGDIKYFGLTKEELDKEKLANTQENVNEKTEEATSGYAGFNVHYKIRTTSNLNVKSFVGFGIAKEFKFKGRVFVCNINDDLPIEQFNRVRKYTSKFFRAGLSAGADNFELGLAFNHKWHKGFKRSTVSGKVALFL